MEWETATINNKQCNFPVVSLPRDFQTLNKTVWARFFQPRDLWFFDIAQSGLGDISTHLLWMLLLYLLLLFI